MNNLSVVDQMLLVFVVCAVAAILIVGLSKIENKIFGTNKINEIFGKKNAQSARKSKVKYAYVFVVIILIIPILFKFGCHDQCREQIVQFFGKR